LRPAFVRSRGPRPNAERMGTSEMWLVRSALAPIDDHVEVAQIWSLPGVGVPWGFAFH
ncbi:MAG: hypothetical protein M1815_000189, partial [Lichina confinis]